MIVSGTEPESAAAGDVLLPRPAATGSLAENMAVSPLFFFSFFNAWPSVGTAASPRRPCGALASPFPSGREPVGVVFPAAGAVSGGGSEAI